MRHRLVWGTLMLLSLSACVSATPHETQSTSSDKTIETSAPSSADDAGLLTQVLGTIVR